MPPLTDSPAQSLARWPAVGLLAVLGLLGSAPSSAKACTVPVYRYALYHWEPRPYEIYWFYDANKSKPSDGLPAAVTALLDDEARQTNVVLASVNLADEKSLDRIYRDVKRDWLARADKSLPQCAIYSPEGRRIFAGRLAPSELTKVFESPARTDLAKQLESGCAGVYVLLEGSDAAANERVAKAIRGVTGEVAAGDIELYRNPRLSPDPDDLESDAEPEFKLPDPKVGFLRLRRGDAAETWFVKSLLALAEGPNATPNGIAVRTGDATAVAAGWGGLLQLAEYATDIRQQQLGVEPMVFMVFGRGRALKPWIGDAIDRDALLQDLDFASGQCKCTDRSLNPGVDLPIRYDWIGARYALAEKHPGELNGGEFAGDNDPGLLFPDPTPAAARSPSPEQPGGPAEPTRAAAVKPAPAANQVAVAAGAKPPDAANSSAVVATSTATADAADAPPAPTVAAEESSLDSWFGVALVIGVAFAVLLAASLVMLRRG